MSLPDEGDVSVIYDDGIVRDTAWEKQQDMAEVAAGLMAREECRARWYGDAAGGSGVAGHDVRFVRKSDEPHVRTADLVMDGDVWEMKAPKSQRLNSLERNLRRALGHSRNVIIDARRMKGIPDADIERELRKWARDMRTLDHLILVNHYGAVLDIK